MIVTWLEVRQLYDADYRSCDRGALSYTFGYTGEVLDLICSMLDDLERAEVEHDS